MTKIAFISFQSFTLKVHPKKFTPKSLHGCKTIRPFGHKPIKTDAKETLLPFCPRQKTKRKLKKNDANYHTLLGLKQINKD
jgi:hypothetical protein